ncbi:hypothetical protein Desor_5447 [Desulfosporosinus orientis DSM 765]|uniref:DUF4231 domain-containing protein n=1 Tax=Desulfosporosinus orientis (strain ATCC 19365 / DSM 765 / NCIMB 8382 / VKM B-1628 / Singapore I) TaxID=768706 RepID=G7WG90_DESOD|nr:DUF4231 domain-containing protein [Desulfosporosinus orientis]AET70822.1 hypothetical protein Desor_5447 [Desulfosporosinus orientis DSM 765]
MDNTIKSEKYIQDRVNEQIHWYSTMSKRNQRMYKLLKTIEIVFAALIPFLVTFVSSGFSSIKVIVGILGISITIISSLLALYRFQENWLEFRTTAESLKREKFLFLARVNIYNSDNALPLFVQRVEDLMSKENTRWLHNMTKKAYESKSSCKEQ